MLILELSPLAYSSDAYHSLLSLQGQNLPPDSGSLVPLSSNPSPALDMVEDEHYV